MRWINPGIERECVRKIDIANIDVIIYTIKAKSLPDFARTICRPVLQGAMIATLDVVRNTIPRPPAQHARRRSQARLALSAGAGVVNSRDVSGADCRIEYFNFVYARVDIKSVGRKISLPAADKEGNTF